MARRTGVHSCETMCAGIQNTRAGIEVSNVKASCGEEHRQHVLWNPSDMNLAAAFTKDNIETRKPIILCLRDKIWSIKYDPTFMSARKSARLRNLRQSMQQPTETPGSAATDCSL